MYTKSLFCKILIANAGAISFYPLRCVADPSCRGLYSCSIASCGAARGGNVPARRCSRIRWEHRSGSLFRVRSSPHNSRPLSLANTVSAKREKHASKISVWSGELGVFTELTKVSVANPAKVTLWLVALDETGRRTCSEGLFLTPRVDASNLDFRPSVKDLGHGLYAISFAKTF